MGQFHNKIDRININVLYGKKLTEANDFVQYYYVEDNNPNGYLRKINNVIDINDPSVLLVTTKDDKIVNILNYNNYKKINNHYIYL